MNTTVKTTGAAEPTTTATLKRRVSKSSKESSRTYINNLPENFQLTNEILKTNVCRLCATYHKSGPELLPLYEVYKGTELWRVVNYLTLIGVNKNDGLPEVICRKCTDQIMAWYRMRKNLIGITRILGREAEILRTGVVNLNERFPESPAASEGGSEQGAGREGSDRAPLAALAAALRALRDHCLAHHAPAPEPPREEASAGEGDPAAFDDLTMRNQRRDRFDPVTRKALDAARARSSDRTHYTCAQCARRLGSAHAFVHHLRIHSGARPHVCHVCGAAFRAPQGLARHLAQTHERRARRACALCSKTFANEQNLAQHMRTHTGERPHECALCGRRFAQSGALHAHRRTHSACRPHACVRCPAAFRLRAGLARHIRSHARPSRSLTRASFPAGTPPP